MRWLFPFKVLLRRILSCKWGSQSSYFIKVLLLVFHAWALNLFMKQNILRVCFCWGLLWATLGNKAEKYTCFHVYNSTGQLEDKQCCCCEVASVVSNSVWPHRRQPTRLLCPWDSPGKNTGVGCHFPLQCLKAKSESEVTQPCPTLRDPMDCSPQGPSVRGIFQARVLEWGAIAFSQKISNKQKQITEYVSPWQGSWKGK